MSVKQMLKDAKTSFLVIEDRTHKDIVVGVPHHAPAGTPRLPCPEHEVADENAGLLGRHLAEQLDCSSVIACNYRVDVNKSLDTDYAEQIARWKPKVLVEIHGHGGKTAKHDIEISSGSSANDKFSKALADKLAVAFVSRANFNGVTVCGEYDKLHFKAAKTATIGNSGWTAYHIELPPKLRMPLGSSTGDPPAIGYEFCEILADALRGIHRSATA